MTHSKHGWALLTVLLASACSGASGPGASRADQGDDTDASTLDAGSGPAPDTRPDGAAPEDDAPAVLDASTPSDAGGPRDASRDDAGGVYDPCPPAGTACAIMPLGDSITDGTAGSSMGGGYRVSLFHRALTDGKTITFVGSGTDGPAMVDGVPFPPHHEGHSGYVIGGGTGVLSFLPGIASLVVNAVQTYAPDIVTLMIGTNDMNDGDDVTNAPARLADLIDSITSINPELLLVVAQIIPSQTDTLNTTIQAYNAAIPALVQARATAGKHVVMVDMYDAFAADANYKTADLSDDLHPNDSGYALMAGVWYTKLAPLLR